MHFNAACCAGSPAMTRQRSSATPGRASHHLDSSNLPLEFPGHASHVLAWVHTGKRMRGIVSANMYTCARAHTHAHTRTHTRERERERERERDARGLGGIYNTHQTGHEAVASFVVASTPVSLNGNTCKRNMRSVSGCV